MRRLAARLAVAAALAAALAAGCAADDPAPPATACFEREQVERALTVAPARVTLAGGATIAACVERARSDEQLQSLGLTLTGVAEGLADRALEDETGAATQLGYLVGAVAKGAAQTQGIQLELARRLEGAARRVDGRGPAVTAALVRGLRAGGRSG